MEILRNYPKKYPEKRSRNFMMEKRKCGYILGRSKKFFNIQLMENYDLYFKGSFSDKNVTTFLYNFF